MSKSITPPIVLLRPVPLQYQISAPFGVVNKKLRGGKPHKGIDFACPTGTPISASADGQVIKAASAETPDDPNHPELGPSKFGNRVWMWVEKPNYTARIGYCHLKSFCVKAGQKIKEGDIIGLSGNTGDSTGPHLHFQINVYPGDAPSDCDFYTEVEKPIPPGTAWR